MKSADERVSDALDRLSDRAIVAEANLLAIRQRVERVRREANQIADADPFGTGALLAELYAHALDDIGAVAGVSKL